MQQKLLQSVSGIKVLQKVINYKGITGITKSFNYDKVGREKCP